MNIKNLDINRKFFKRLGATASIVLMTVVLSTTSGFGNWKRKSKKEQEENSVGYSNINPGRLVLDVPDFLKKGATSNDFVILDAGNSKLVEVSFLEKKIEYCNDEDIAVGLIVTPNSVKLNDMYDNIEMIKGFVNKFDIEFPIYIDIDYIMENNSLSVSAKKELILTALNSLESNGIYVAVRGTDTNLNYLYEYCGIKDYDALVVKVSDNIEYKGKYSLYEGYDGKIYRNPDYDIVLEKVINKKELNVKEKLKNNGIHIVKENDILLDIAMKYNLSVNDLLKYNDIKEEDFAPGLKLKIPSVISDLKTNSENKEEEFKILEKPIRGSDFSHFQVNEEMNWDLIKENFEFAILKCSEGTTFIDEDFEEFSRKCTENDIPYGVYCVNAYNYMSNGKDNYSSIDEFLKAQNNQVNTCLKTISNKNITYPVYLDIEGSVDEVKSHFTEEQMTVMLDNWYNKISDNYIPGLYCGHFVYEWIKEFYDLSKWSIWAARYEYDNTKISLNETKVPTYEEYLEIGNEVFQTSKTTEGVGAPVGEGVTDINYSFVDYSKKSKSSLDTNFVGLDIKEINRIETAPILAGVGIVLGGTGISIISYGIKLIKNKTKKRKRW